MEVVEEVVEEEEGEEGGEGEEGCSRKPMVRSKEMRVIACLFWGLSIRFGNRTQLSGVRGGGEGCGCRQYLTLNPLEREKNKKIRGRE